MSSLFSFIYAMVMKSPLKPLGLAAAAINPVIVFLTPSAKMSSVGYSCKRNVCGIVDIWMK